MSASIVNTTKNIVDRALTYKTDRDNHQLQEHWRSHAEDIIATPGYRAYGDCDDFALTYAEMLILSGIARHRVAVVYCEIRGYGGHLVCVVDNNVVLDNNFKKPRMKTSLRREGYTFISQIRLDDPSDWIPIDS